MPGGGEHAVLEGGKFNNTTLRRSKKNQKKVPQKKRENTPKIKNQNAS